MNHAAGSHAARCPTARSCTIRSRVARSCTVRSHAAESYAAESHAARSHTVRSHTAGNHTFRSHTAGDGTPGSPTAGGHTDGSHTAGGHTAGSHTAGGHTAGSCTVGGHTDRNHAARSHTVGSHTAGRRTAGGHTARSRTAGSCIAGCHIAGGHTAWSHAAGSPTTRSHTAGGHAAGSHVAWSHAARDPTVGSHAAGGHTAGGHTAESHTARSHAAMDHTAGGHTAESHTARSHAAMDPTAGGPTARSHAAGGHRAGSPTAGSHAAEGPTARIHTARSHAAMDPTAGGPTAGNRISPVLKLKKVRTVKLMLNFHLTMIILLGPPSKKSKCTPSAQPPIGQIQLSADMAWQIDHWRQKLAASYLAEESKSDAWPPVKIVDFVQLALVKQDKRSQHLDLRTIKSDIDQVYGQKVNMEYDDLFRNLDYSSLILIEGRPGSGKTTLLARISCDWAKGNIARSKLIISVRLRYLDKTREVNLHDLLLSACPDNDILGLSSYIEGRFGEDVVFLLDGFDEYGVRAGAHNFICNLINRKILSKSTVILSSRPAATQAFHQIATQWIEVVGFMKEQVMRYIQTYYEHDKEKGLQLEQHLNNHTNVLNLCYLPLYCAMLVHLYEQESLLPETETEFYRYFTLSSIFRTISKSTQGIDKLTSFNQLPPKEKSVFDEICQLAFRATVESRQVFEKSEIIDICGAIGSINEKENPGLLVIDRCLATVGYDSKYSFLHLTLQEYLSAVYITGRDNSEQVTIVRSNSDKKHLYVMWRFLFGIMDYSQECTVNLFKLILDATHNDSLYHIRCAYESQHSAASTEVLQFNENNLMLIEIEHFDLACISYVLKTAELLHVLCMCCMSHHCSNNILPQCG